MNNKRKIEEIIKDKQYFAKCIRQLKSWGAPLEGWKCTRMFDVRENDDTAELFTCELCGCSRVRFVHIMEHEKYFEEVWVGCICAGFMEGNIYKAEERERLMRNRSKRRKNFLKHHWKHDSPNVWERTYRKSEMEIRQCGDCYMVRAGGKVAFSYKGYPITSFYSAVYAAFDMADPLEAVL